MHKCVPLIAFMSAHVRLTVDTYLWSTGLVL